MKRLLLLLLITFSLTANSQKRELGNVTIEELKQKKHSTDTSAVAAILFKTGDVTFNYSQQDGFYIRTNIKAKIKVYKKDGYNWGNFEVLLYNETNAKQSLEIKSAFTYNLVGDKIEKSKLKSDGEFEEKVNKFWTRKKITMPNVKEGSIIEIEYNIKDEGTGLIDEWAFQEQIPVDYSEYSTKIPEYYVYNTHFRGWLVPKITNEDVNESIELRSKERQEIRGRMETANYSEDQITYRLKKTNYKLENIPAIKNEYFTNNIKNYTSSLVLELSMTKFPNQMTQNYSSDWETVTKKIYEYDDFGPELNKTGYFEKDIDELLKGVVSPAEKTGLIFSYVKNRMNWNEMYGYSCQNGVRKAYQDKTGNAAEINLMLTSMLRYAGLSANPILISTRSNGVALYPSRSAFNYVISGVEVENQIIMLDATNKFSLPGILPIRDLNWYGRIIRNNGSSANVNLIPQKKSIDAITLMGSISKDGEITGKVRKKLFDYNAFIFRNNYNNISKESYIEKLEKENLGLEIEEYEVQNNVNLNEPIVESYTFKSTNSVEIIGDKLYVSPLLYFTMKENPFKQESREYPVDFVFPNQDNYKISLTIPEGYTVETLPASKVIAMPDNMAKFSYEISKSNNQIQLSYIFDTNNVIIENGYYETLKNFFKELVNKNNEHIVLKKI
ncbi:transglutaminase [Flavobacterium sp.]|uniref:transglutaminase n=1 Tax=Flavobacterium sp. TaxID=239 RepID=UPI0008B9C244|nr:transglutaminase [Flavobacterium sp.]OGS61434.1 MAG: transglutaminase [Flavobacteria bacterium GWF1_32_7]HBD27001.1 transglutaminase [Flavobacterium sp.]